MLDSNIKGTKRLLVRTEAGLPNLGVTMTCEEKLRIYERVFHTISYCVTAMNHHRIKNIVDLIHNWSYSHRYGNGELSEEEVEANILKALEKLKNV